MLQHVPRRHLFDAVLAIRDALRPGGRALVVLPFPRPGLDPDSRDSFGRLFTQLTAEELELLFERLGFVSLARWTDDDALHRPGLRWTTLLLQRSRGTGAPAIDERATGIRAREKKVASYELALLRALTDIGRTEAHRVRFLQDARLDDLAWDPMPDDRVRLGF